MIGSGHSIGVSAEICFGFFSDVGSVEGLAYHRPWDTLYWTSSTTSTISRQALDQSRTDAFRRQAVVTLSEDDHPHVLALDECQRSVPPLHDIKTRKALIFKSVETAIFLAFSFSWTPCLTGVLLNEKNK